MMHKNITKMKIKEISVSYSESVNTGNFENVKWNITKVVEVQESDDESKVTEELTNNVYKTVKNLVNFTKLKKITMSSAPNKKGVVKKVNVNDVEDYELENRKHENKIS